MRVGQKFRRRLESDRQAVINEFEQEFADWLPVFGTIDDLVVRTVGRAILVLTAPDFTDGARCSYLSVLFASFLKTHFICGDLIKSCLIAEAGTLMRKQLEVLARIKQLTDSGDFVADNQRPPNISTLSSVRRHYGELSKISHSWDWDTLLAQGVPDQENNSVVFSETAMMTPSVLTLLDPYVLLTFELVGCYTETLVEDAPHYYERKLEPLMREAISLTEAIHANSG